MATKALSRFSGILAHPCLKHGLLLRRKGFELFVDFLARGEEVLARESLKRRLGEIRRQREAAERRKVASAAPLSWLFG